MPMRLLHCFALIATGLALAGGCAKPPRGNPESKTDKPFSATKLQGKPETDNNSLAQKVLNAYRVGFYSDSATMMLSYVFEDGRRETSATTYALQFAAPNRLRLQVSSADNEVHVLCDGKQLIARISDPITRNFDGQVVVRDAPEKLALADVYAATELVAPATPDEMLSALMGAPAGLELTPLSLLLGDGRLVEILNNATLVPDSDDRIRPTLEARVNEGVFQFEIDPETFAIRRMEFPPTTTNLPPEITRVELVAEFTNASFTETTFDVDDALTRIVQDADHQVNHFVLPPFELATSLLGKQIDGLQLVDATGRSFAIRANPDAVQLLVWFHDHPASLAVIEQLDALRNSTGAVRVDFFAVSVDSEAKDPTRMLQQWGSHLPGFRDPQATGRDVLGVRQAPTTLVIGPDGRLHYFEVGANPNISRDLSLVIESLQRGEDVAQRTIDQHNASSEAYQRQLSLAKAGDGWTEDPITTLQPASPPQHLQWRKLWETTEIAEPGNMLLIPGREPSVLVLDGWNQLVQLSGQGEVMRRIKLDLPADEGVSLVRGGVDVRGNVILAAAARGGRHAFVFDSDGKRLLQYPDDADRAAAVRDLLIADLDGNDRPELYVGWQGNLGVHGVRLDGTRLWSNRAVSGVTSLAIAKTSASRTTRTLIVAGESGAIVVVDQHGRTLRQLTVGDRPLHQVAAWPGAMRYLQSLVASDAPPKETQSNFCGFTFSAAGTLAAVGLSHNLEFVWQQPQPSAVFQYQVDLPQTMTISADQKLWLLPGGDGSLSFIAADGQFTDRLHVGQHIRGLGAMQYLQQSVLILATDGTVTGYVITNND